LDGFAATPLHCPGQPDPMLHADLVRSSLKRLLPLAPPELLIVQGDTSSALGGALASRELGIPLAHVESGLRTYDPSEPWPEEENRVTIDRLADLLFAPTSSNAANLRRDGVTGRIHVTGNSGIDALAELVGKLPAKPRRRWPWRPLMMLVTCHRRENWGAGLDGVAKAIAALCGHRAMADVLLPPNPTVTERMTKLLGGKQGIRLIPPLSHRATIEAMRDADLVLSDSGGMQEEAPALGVPLLILRDKTERPEGVATGTMMLAGTDPDRIVAIVDQLRRNRSRLAAMRMPCLPFGDGQAAPRIARHCLIFLEEAAAARASRIA
jgi:UDP-N-acetylglucosamine 2-epimerase (non-hydrolysing)